MTTEKLIHILMVEDSPSDVKLAMEGFKAAKMANEVYVVSDGVEALAYLRREEPYSRVVLPDLILLDLNLPRKDGRQVLAEVKEDPELRHIPVVVLTSSQAEEDIVKTYDLHANAYVTKPVDFPRFVEVVRQIDQFWFGVVQLPIKPR